VNETVYCAGQVGRTSHLEVLEDPESQFVKAWKNLRIVLTEAQCTFDDIVEMTTYHVSTRDHMSIFRKIKDRLFPRKTCTRAYVGVVELAPPGLLVESKCIAVPQN
jgi:enamine deaminase RidA (YjgF/YER057c/UK114 family)